MAIRRLSLVLVLALLGTLGLRAAEPDYLVRVERRADADLRTLLGLGVPVVLETKASLFAEVTAEQFEGLRKRSWDAAIVDLSPRGWDYVQVGLRPDSDREALAAAGSIVYAEENWVLLRLWPGAGASALSGARVFAAPVSHRALAPPGPEAGTPYAPERLYAADPLVQQMVAAVTPADVDAYWEAVVPPNPPGTGTRYTTSQGCTNAVAYCFGEFDGFDLAPQYQNYRSGYAPNVIGTRTGAVSPEKVYIVVGHIDDMPSSGYAPGADDNASGTVVVLESAKVLSCYAFKSTVKFIAVTGEETGLEGSTAYAAAAQSSGEAIQGVINMDMPGWQGDNSPPGENLDLNYDANSQPLGLFFQQAASTYGTGLAVDAFLCPSLTASDHYPFWQRGFKAVCGITDNEGYCGHAGHYPYYHTSNDTIANCGARTFFYNVVKTSVAALASLAEPFRVTFEKASYGCGATAAVLVGDRDLNTNPGSAQTAQVAVWSTTETTPETITVTEQGADSMLFRGTAGLTSGPPVHGDGLISVSAGDTLTVSYVDAADCGGGTNVSHTATAAVDCMPPVITNVQVTGVTESSATVTWSTSEAANGRVTYGASAPPATVVQDLATYTTGHSLDLTGLAPCTDYVFSVTSTDVAGNSATDANGGLYYGFTTAGRAYVLGPMDAEGATTGWSATGQWHVSTCRANSPTHAWKAGSTSCSANYANNTDSYLTSPSFALGAPGHGYHLRFREWYQTEADYDWCTPQISTNGGSSWSNLGTHYAGSNGGWSSRDFDLAAWSGADVRVRFWLHADSSYAYEGWYVDDVDVGKPDACGLLPLACTASGSPLSGVAPLTVAFQAGATGGTPPYAYAWDFGDGSPAGSGDAPSHVYAAAGSYSARLTVTDSGIPIQTALSAPLAVSVAAPLSVSASANPTEGTAPLAVTFQGSAAGGTPPYVLTWTFGDGSPTAGGSPVSHTYAAAGSYTARLSIADAGTPGQTVQSSPLTITVAAPLAVTGLAAPTSGTAPLKVLFQALGTGGYPPYTYTWLFGDGSPAGSGESLQHTYADAGSFTVGVSVKDGHGATAFGPSLVITVLATLAAQATVTPTSGPAPLPVTCQASASGGQPPYTYAWDFGDGSTAAGASAGHTYAAPGSYPVSLTATDAAARTIQAEPVVVSVGQPLSAAFTGSPTSGVAPLHTVFSASVSGGSPPYAYAWDFGDGSAAGSGQTTAHDFAAGSHTVHLTVTDSAVPPASVQAGALAVTAREPLAAAIAASPLEGVAPLTVNFQTSPAGGLPPYAVSWSTGDGSSPVEGATGSHTYQTPGSFGLTATVTDGDDPPQTLTAGPVPVMVLAPLSLSVSADPVRGTAPLAVTFEALASGGKAPYAVAWSFGDGAAGSGEAASHTYATPGSYLATATLTDAGGRTATASAAVTAVPPLALAVSASPLSGGAPLAVAFHATPSGGQGPFTFAWTFGDGAAASGESPSHTYGSAGTFTAAVTATDAEGRVASSSLEVAVLPPPRIFQVLKKTAPFRLKILGADFHAGCTVFIDGVAVPDTKWVGDGALLAKKGAALKAMCPKGQTVEITVVNGDDGGVSAPAPYTR